MDLALIPDQFSSLNLTRSNVEFDHLHFPITNKHSNTVSFTDLSTNNTVKIGKKFGTERGNLTQTVPTKYIDLNLNHNSFLKCKYT